MLRAQGKWALFSDADLSTPIEELEKLAAYLQQGYAITFFNRFDPPRPYSAKPS